MTEKEMLKDMEKSYNFEKRELQKNEDERPNTFKSWEFYIIFYYTNSQHYYMNDEIENLKEYSELIQKTEKGIFYCFN